MKWISYNIFQNFPLFRIHRVGGTGVSFALMLVLAIKIWLSSTGLSSFLGYEYVMCILFPRILVAISAEFDVHTVQKKLIELIFLH